MCGCQLCFAFNLYFSVIKFLSRFFTIVALLCGLLGFGIGVKAQAVCHDEQKNEEQIQEADGFLRQVAEEPQSPVRLSLCSRHSSNRVASSRSSRVQTTHGGRTNHTHGRVLTDVLSYLYRYLPLDDVSSKLSSAWAFASPRLYYVIALRRLLC